MDEQAKCEEMPSIEVEVAGTSPSSGDELAELPPASGSPPTTPSKSSSDASAQEVDAMASKLAGLAALGEAFAAIQSQLQSLLDDDDDDDLDEAAT